LPSGQRGFMPYRRTMVKQTVLGSILLLLQLGGSALAQALPRDEQQFCDAFPAFREALRQAHSNSMEPVFWRLNKSAVRRRNSRSSRDICATMIAHKPRSDGVELRAVGSIHQPLYIFRCRSKETQHRANPGAAHDDFVDATVQALTFLRETQAHAIANFYHNKVIAASTGTTDAFRSRPGTRRHLRESTPSDRSGLLPNCHTSLFQKASVDAGLGQLCIPFQAESLSRFANRTETKFPAQRVEEGTRFPDHSKKFPARLSSEFAQTVGRT
jgi:hypothetical protein